MKKSETDENSSVQLLFEKLYIFTVQDVYQHVILLMDSFRDIKELMIRTYLNVYMNMDQLPGQDDQLEWLCKIADQLAETKFEVDPSVIEASYQEEVIGNRESGLRIDETSIYLDIEERISLLKEDDTDEKQTRLISGMQGMASLCLLAGAVVILSFGISKVRSQLDILRQPIVTPLDDAEGNPGNINKQDIKIVINNKEVYLSDIGEVKYSIPLEPDHSEQTVNPEIQTQAGWTYYLPIPEREDTVLSNVAPFLHHTLYRINFDNEIEIVATEVEDYTFWEDNIYVSQFGRIQKIDKNQTFETLLPGVYPQERYDDIYIYDMMGKPLTTEVDGTIVYHDRVFKMSDHRIVEVQPSVRKRDETTYYFKSQEDGLSKEIYSSTDAGEEPYIQIGERIDSFCIAGDWLYFSAYVRNGGSGAHYSELYRKSLKDESVPEKIHDEYAGRMLQMYYNEIENKIYANYIPESWKNNYGVIAVISMSGQMSYLDDTQQRSTVETTGNDMLEFVMVYDNQVYCYWQDCIWEPGENPVAIWRKVLVIPDSSVTPIRD